jgi:hypothetical protein
MDRISDISTFSWRFTVKKLLYGGGKSLFLHSVFGSKCVFMHGLRFRIYRESLFLNFEGLTTAVQKFLVG